MSRSKAGDANLEPVAEVPEKGTDNRPTGSPDLEDRQTLQHMFEVMTKIKVCDERVRKGMGTGEFAFVYFPPRGQEAIAAAMAVSLRADDYLVTAYRALHQQIAKGVPLAEILGESLGRQVGTAKGKGGAMHIAHPDSGLMLSSGIVGAPIPIGAGVALAAQLSGSDRVTVTTFGDGAANTGAFHEGLNLAAVWNLPVVFLCENNLYAEMTPIARSTRNTRLSERAIAYGFPGETVDGNDPLAVCRVLMTAVDRARKGGGPTLIECVTFCLCGHYFGDPMEYMPSGELEAAKRNDPVIAFRSRLVAGGSFTEDELARVESAAERWVESALKAALSSPEAPAEEALTDVYSTTQGVRQ